MVSGTLAVNLTQVFTTLNPRKCFPEYCRSESKAASILRQVMWGRHHLLCSQTLTGPEDLRVPEMGHASLGTWGRSLSKLHMPKATSPESLLR